MKKSRFQTLFMQDLLIALRNRFHLFILAIMAVSVAVVYLIPDEFEYSAGTVYLYVKNEDVESPSIAEIFTGPHADFVAVESEEQLMEQVGKKNINRGILLDAGGEIPELTYFHNGSLPEREFNIISARLQDVFGGHRVSSSNLQVRELGGAFYVMPNSVKLLVILLAFEVVIIGYLFSAVMIFQEKQEGTIRSYRTTPGGLVPYLAAKVVFWTLTGIVYAVLLLLATTRFSLHIGAWLQLLGGVALSSFFFTALGTGIAVYFNNISEWFIIGVGVLILNMLPILGFESPAFAPGWLSWIPSHPFLFWVRDVFQGTGGSGNTGLMAGKLGLFAAAVLPFTLLSVRRRLMKEGSK